MRSTLGTWIRYLPRLLLVTTAALALPSRAGAQARDAAAGEALFQEGRRLMKAGDFASACSKLEESFRLDPALGTLVNLASCEEQLGHTATAWQHWRAAADQLPSGDKRRATAVARAGALEKVLPRLTIALGPEVSPEAEVKRDGVRLGRASLGLPLPVDPGRHVVVVAAPGREPREYEVTLKARENQTLTVEPGAEVKVARPEPAPERWSEERPAPALAAHPVPPSPGRKLPVAGIVLLSGGAVALGTATVFGLQALKARKDAQTACPGAAPSFCWKDAKAPLDRDRRFSLYADVGFAAGILLAGAGLYFVLRGPGETTAEVSALPGGGAVSFAGRF
jgi:tetratricopeptide (TPR) repeat protein